MSGRGPPDSDVGHIEIRYRYFYRPLVSPPRKVTVEIPADLLARGQKSMGEGITGTIRQGLELVAAGRAYEELRRLRGGVSFSIDWRKIREDRS